MLEFNIVEYIGKGMNAKIYRGHLRDGTYIAVKQNLYPSNSKRTTRFDNECLILKSMDHPNIVGYVNSIRNLLLIELMDGDLSMEILHPYFDVKKCILDIARGLDYLHNMNPLIIHRDIKVENMMVSKTNGIVNQTKIGDFGFAVVCPEGYLTSYSKTGTPIYMAHEIVSPFHGDKIYYTPASDIWAFGILCWHILTKKIAYSFIRNCEEYRRYIMDGNRESFKDVKGDKKLFDLIEKCWYEDVTSRPIASDFINLLECKLISGDDECNKNPQ